MDWKALLNEILSSSGHSLKCSAVLIPVALLLFGPENFLVLLTIWSIATILSSKFVRNCIVTAPRDLTGYFCLQRLQSEMEAKWAEGEPIGEHFQRVVDKHPRKACIIEADTGRSLNFQELNVLANGFGNFFATQAIPGEETTSSLGLLLGNSIEFVAIWLGLSRIGRVSAWLNTQLRGESLAHSIRIANCTALITSPELLPALSELRAVGLLGEGVKIFVLNAQKNDMGEGLNVRAVNANDLRDHSMPLCREEQTNFRSVLAYLFTSGTTGEPKAVVIRHYRYYFMGIAGPLIYGIRPSDRLYVTLPMYHGMAGIASVGQMVVNGCTIVIRAKFSASHFWSDCHRLQCTVGIYIGEICRYLLSQPPCPEERKHKVRLFCGLGLRPAIWRAFVQRFGIPHIGELYGATEGNATCVNMDYREGACGFLPILTALMARTSIRLVKLDPETGEYLRHGPDSLCVLCRPGETGEIVGMIRDQNPTRRFEGYLQSAETEKKLLRNVEAPGDCAFASGDILHWNERGYLFFKDRRGDTFRWRGENVSCTEVENVLQDMEAIADVAVYGVEMPGEEGKAGMCALALNMNGGGDGADVEALLDQIGQRFRRNLAPFAIPLFVRICPAGLERTGTFKLKKANLQREGFRLSTQRAAESLFLWDRQLQRYQLYQPPPQCEGKGEK